MIEIRKYKETDKSQVQYICKATAGEFFSKNEIILNALPLVYNDYFTENEADNIFVLSDDGKAVGYILCSSDYRSFMKKMRKIYLPKIRKQSLFLYAVAVGYLATMVLATAEYGTHLHIDLLPEYQHMGYGSQMIDVLRKHLSAKGIETLSVNVIERNSDACKFYVKCGFEKNKTFTKDLISLKINTKGVVK